MIDDIHACDDETRNVLLAKIRALVDGKSDSGQKNVVVSRSWDGQVIEKPSRNLSLILTMNIVPDKVKKAFIKEKTAPTVNEQILATLSAENKVMDDSFIKRFGGVIVLNTFPKESKSPTLTTSLRNASQEKFLNESKYFVTSPIVVESLSNWFSNADARTFLSTATAELDGLIDYSYGRGAYIIVPNARLTTFPGRDQEGEFKQIKDGKQIEQYIKSYTQAIPIGKGRRSQLGLLNILVDSLRSQALDAFVKALASDIRMSGEVIQKSIVSPTLHALGRHLTMHPRIPLSILSIDLYKLGIRTSADAQEYEQALSLYSLGGGSYFPVVIGSNDSESRKFKEFIDSSVSRHVDRTRHDVLRESVADLEATLLKALTSAARIESFDAPILPESWLKNLSSKENTNVIELQSSLISHYLKFITALEDPGLLEKRSDIQVPLMTPYDRARLFAYVLDRVVAKLPWADALKLVSESLEVATRDASWGQSDGVQHYLFKSKTSLLNPLPNELISQTIQGIGAYRYLTPGDELKRTQYFQANCSSMLLRSDARGGSP